MNTSLSNLLPLLADRSHGPCVAIDVGAHHGEFSKFLIQSQIFKKVLAFEPNPISYNLLNNSVSQSKTCLFEAHNIALSDKSGELDLFCDEDTATASLLPYDSNYETRGPLQKQRVPVFTLDQYLDINHVGCRVSCLKIDTQGNDLAVILGAINTIMQNRPIVQVEFIYIPLYQMQCSPWQLDNQLAQLNYQFYSLNNLHVNAEGRLSFCDALYVPKEVTIPSGQEFHCIDDGVSKDMQLKVLSQICSERLDVIDRLDTEVRYLQRGRGGLTNVISLLSWLRFKARRK